MNETTRLILTPTTIQTEGDTCNIMEAFQLTLSAQKQFLNTLLHQANDEEYPEVYQALYDFANQAYGNLLSDLFPDLHNAHITDETIDKAMQAQDEFIQAAIDELKQTNPRRYKKAQKGFQKHQSSQRAKIIELNMLRRQQEIRDVQP